MTTMETTKGTNGNLPVGWRWVRLGEVCEKQTGIRDPRTELDTAFQYVDITSVSNVHKCITEARTILGKDAPSRARQVIRANDIIVATTRPNLNAVALVPPELDDQICSTGFCVLRAGANILPDYLFAFVRHESFIKALTDLVKGALYPAVNDGQVKAQPIPLPSLDEQKRITGVLHEQMAGVEKARAAAKERQAAAKALPMAYLRKVFDAPHVREWGFKRLGDILIPHKDMIHPGDRANGTAKFVGLEHLEPHTGRRLGSLTLDLTQLTGRKPTFRRGQIVYGYLRPYLNKVWIAEFDGCSSVDQFAYDVRSDVADVRFVAWFMRSPLYLRRSAVVTTTGQLPRIGTEQIAAVEIALPPLDRQRVIAHG